MLDRPNTQTEPILVNPPRVTVAATPSAGDFGDIGQYAARRLLALLTDLIVVAALIAVTIHYLVVQRGLDASSNQAFLATLVYAGLAFVVYLCVAEAYPGTSLGKALFGLRVQALDGGRVGIGRAVARNLFLPFDLLIVGFLLALVTPRHRRLGDFVAGTEVVNLRAGLLAPVVAAALLGTWAYVDYAFADGLQTAQSLGGDLERYGPSLIAGQATPAPGPTPLPARTQAPTEQPITVPTIEPSGTASPPSSPQATTPSGGEAAGVEASPATSPALSPSASAVPSSSASSAPSSSAPQLPTSQPPTTT